MAAVINIDVMITNLQAAFSSLMYMVSAISYIMGIGFMAKALMKLKSFGHSITQMSQHSEMAPVLVLMGVGAALLYLPSTIDVGLLTIYGSSSLGNSTEILDYTSGIGLSEKWNLYSEVLVDYMKLIGLIAFIRGWAILSKVGQQGGQPGTVGKGLTHVIGGILLINIVDTVHVLATTFGFTGV